MQTVSSNAMMNDSKQPVVNTNNTFRELDNLFSAILQTWNLHPTHFGFPRFDDFVASLPNIYYHLITFQRLERLHQQQINMAMNKSGSANLLQLTEQYQPPQPVQPLHPAAFPDPSHFRLQPQPPAQPAAPAQAEPESEIEVVEEDKNNTKNNPFSLLPAKRNKYKKQKKVSTLDPIVEGKPSPSPPLSPCSSPSSSPSPCYSSMSACSLSLSQNERLNAFAAEFVPVSDEEEDEKQKPYKVVEAFRPKHAARAKLNIYIPKHMTKQLLPKICEAFPNTNTLYYYLDISTALQINDGQMTVLQTDSGKKIVLVNYDLHRVDTEELLYAVVTPNDEHKVEANTEKWLWKIEEFLTEQEIVDKYQIAVEDFPASSRSMAGRGIYDQFKLQLSHIGGLNDMSTLHSFQWHENAIKQIGSSQKSKKGKKLPVVRVALDIEEWLRCCQRSWGHLPAIPIIVYENRDINQHWIEWVKMVYIPSQDCYVGVSFKFNEESKTWQIESVCLDKGDMHNKHRLISLRSKEGRARCNNTSYEVCFERFNTRITELEWN